MVKIILIVQEAGNDMVRAHELDITYTPPSDLIVIEGLGVKGVRKIKKQIHLAIIRGITKAVAEAVTLAIKIVPESHPNNRNPRPYPDSYETEQLMHTYIDELNRSLTKMKRGKTTLRKSYTLQQLGWDEVSYAELVNKMIGVKWTKKSSESDFIGKLCKLLQTLVPLYIDKEIQLVDRGQQILHTGTYNAYSSGDYTSWGIVGSG